MDMDKRARERALFESIRVEHGIPTIPSRIIDERARKQWLETHDRIPALDEIDQVIEEVRSGR